MYISTSVWSVQHPNAGRNIQHMHVRGVKLYEQTFAPNIPVITGLIYKIAIMMMIGPNKND